MEQNTKKNFGNKRTISKINLTIVIIILALSIGGVRGYFDAKGESPMVVTDVSVTDFVEKDQLNTFRTNYEDVVTVFDEKKEEKIDYHVSYKATVDVGINFGEINIKQDNKEKTINIFVPNAAIQNVNIDITTLDFMFYDKKADNEDVLNNAYEICKKDAEKKLKNKDKIIELANENVQNIINAYLQPFMEMTNNQYQVEYIIGDTNENE